MPILLLTLADAALVAVVVAVVFESDELPNEDCTPVLITLRCWALPFQRVLAKFVLAVPGNLLVGCLQCDGLIGRSKGLLSDILPSSSRFYFKFWAVYCFFLAKTVELRFIDELESMAGRPYVYWLPTIRPF